MLTVDFGGKNLSLSRIRSPLQKLCVLCLLLLCTSRTYSSHKERGIRHTSCFGTPKIIYKNSPNMVILLCSVHSLHTTHKTLVNEAWQKL